MPVKFQPDGFHTLTPYLMIKGAAKAIDFYKQAFGAVELMRLGGPDGNIGHAEIRIGDSIVMMADECPQSPCKSPTTLGGSPVGLMIYVEDSDKMFAQAVAAGATVSRPIADQFYGDRSGTVVDPFGHFWTISTHKEDVPPEEITRRLAAMAQK
jgi:PhnB protein